MASIMALLAAVAGQARAYEPHAATITVAAAKAAGSVDLAAASKKFDTVVKLLITNLGTTKDLLVKLPLCTYDKVSQGLLVSDLEGILGRSAAPVGTTPNQEPAWAACVLSRSSSPGVFQVPAGGSFVLKVGIDFRALGNQHVVLNSQVYRVQPQERRRRAARAKGLTLAQTEDILRGLSVAAEEPVSLFYAVELDERQLPTFRLSTYEDLYLQGQPTDEATGGGLSNNLYVDGALPVALDEFQTFKPVVPDSAGYNPAHPDIREIATGTSGPAPGDLVCVDPGRHDCTANQCSGGARGGGGAPTFTVTGRFSSKWTDHTLHPAWGWRAVAWWNNGGSWTLLADDWVQWDGSYQLTFDVTGYSGQHLRMQFRAYNQFFRPQDEDGNTYRWKNPDRSNIATNHDEGHYYADCDGTSTNGLGEMYFRGYQLWSKMYWTAEINPLRASAINIFYPNTFENCGGSSPWSCAGTGGNIWLIPAHGTNRGTVQHELGHQINYEFWSNKRPASPAGAHSADECYTYGLALLEGYANYVPIWVQTNRSAVPDSDIRSYAIETPGSDICQSPGTKNEAWVSATFWDLHDSHTDGNDILWFKHQGAVHAIYLANGPANDGDDLRMSDFRTPYRTAASAGHQGYIDDIFAQNDTD